MFRSFLGKREESQPFIAPPEHAQQPKLGDTSSIAEVEAIGTVCVVTATAERINAHSAGQLYELIANLAEQGFRTFVLDLQNSTYLDSAGLGVLIRLLKALEEVDGRIALSSVNPYVASLFRITRLDRAFPICKDALTAMEALERAA